MIQTISVASNMCNIMYDLWQMGTNLLYNNLDPPL